MQKSFFAHIFIKSRSIYLKPRPKWSTCIPQIQVTGGNAKFFIYCMLFFKSFFYLSKNRIATLFPWHTDKTPCRAYRVARMLKIGNCRWNIARRCLLTARSTSSERALLPRRIAANVHHHGDRVLHPVRLSVCLSVPCRQRHHIPSR